jgi:hypothetical protein
LVEADEINRFKTDSEYAEDAELATMHRVLEILRAAINWGMAQTPPLLAKSPFHRFGVRLNKKAETMRQAIGARGGEAAARRRAGEDEYAGAFSLSARCCTTASSAHSNCAAGAARCC